MVDTHESTSPRGLNALMNDVAATVFCIPLHEYSYASYHVAEQVELSFIEAGQSAWLHDLDDLT
jgi:hypothetical protein